MKEAHVDLWQRYAAGAAIAVTTNGALAPDGRAQIGWGTARQASARFPWFASRLGEALAARGNHVALLGERLASFPVEQSPFDIPDLDLIVRSARELVQLCGAQGWAEVVLPRPGCGGGGLDWSEVSPLLAPVLDDRFLVVTWESGRGSRA